ncbi:MAG: UDP-N-acetylmuramoyl-L-alanine--D-glutamate ligase [Methanobacterium sp.]|nr:UDP-N-acetylmuramoyl-L-alanine--D-glutamate ligase [Methanobacterium sp.]
MKSIVIGAGNAGRPVARILNYIGHEVKITDQKKLAEFPEKYQKILLQMEKEGVELNLGIDMPLELDSYDSVYLSPNIPQESPVREKVNLSCLEIINHEYISRIINELIDIDIIGVTGTLGKTSTTHIISRIFEACGYKVWKCSSRHGNLLSEVIIQDIINQEHSKNDVAVFELPHGTSRLMSQVKLKIGLLTNIYPEHLDEFEDSLEKYAERKLFIANSSEILISTPQCREYLEPLRDDTIYYCTKENNCNITGHLENEHLIIDYDLTSLKGSSILDNPKGSFESLFKLKGYYFENSTAASTVALCYGLDGNVISNGLKLFKGIAGHMEYLGNYCGREIHFDAAFVPEGLVSTLEQFSNGKLVVLVDNPDTSTVRDKYKIGEVIGQYADIVISSGYNETLGGVNMEAAHEVLKGIGDVNCQKIPVENMIHAGNMSIKVSNPGDTILHVGPGAITNYQDLKTKMLQGIEDGCNKYS